jgi:alpha-mannosidase
MPFAGRQYAFLAEVPALGYRCFHARAGAVPTTSTRTLEATRTTLENDWWRIELDPYDGHITRLWDKVTQVDVLRAGLVLTVLQDNSDTWSHVVREYRIEAGRFGNARLQVVETGDVLATLQIESSFGNSQAIQELTLYRDTPRIDSRIQVNWQEAYHMLKIGFDTHIVEGEATYETPYASQVREANGEEQPGQQWFDLSGRIGETPYGLAIHNDGQYSFDIRKRSMRVTALRSPAYAHHDPARYSRDTRINIMDQGWHTFHLQLQPHTGTWRDAPTVHTAWEHNAPCIAHVESAHPGTRPGAGSMLACDADHVVISVFKQQEDTDGLVLRAYETIGKECTATVQLPLLEQSLTVTLKPYEVKTLCIDPSNWTSTETNLLEE